ncbi:MAG: hypothetical protein M3R02_02650 [Chloroflexota bacterium]|nr:hypothetical protein [Chloroflexota bacterium]
MPGREGPRRQVQRPAPAVLGLSLTDFRRLYRWLNLTLIHQAVWPALLLLTNAPAGAVERLPLRWYLIRLAAPALAAGLALVYLAQPPARGSSRERGESRPAPHLGPIQVQARLILFGLAAVLALARFALGPPGPALRLLVFGAADVAAFHLIHFGVVLRSSSSQDAERGAVALFTLSWGLRTALLVAVGAGRASVLLGFVGGVVLGAVIGAGSLALRRWLGGALAGAAFHWLVIYLILEFAG